MEEELQLLSARVQIVLAGIQMATLIALVAYVVYTAKMAKTMRAAHEAQTRPYVVAYADVLPNNRVDLVVANVGQGLATDVVFSMTPTPVALRDELMESFLARGLKYAPPGWETRCVWTTGPQIEDLPSTYEMTMRYSDGRIGTRFEETHTIVLEELGPIALEGRKPIHEIVLELAALRKEVASGLAVTGPAKTDFGGSLPVRVKSVPPGLLQAVRPISNTPSVRRHVAEAPWERRPTYVRRA